MPLHFYHIAHIVGLVFVFIGFGCLLTSEGAKSAMKWHGTGLLISLVTGFGMLARLQISWPWPTWVIVKVSLWVVLAVLPILAKRRVVAAPVVVILVAAVGGVLAYMGYLKPTF